MRFLGGVNLATEIVAIHVIWKIWDQLLSFVPHSVGVYGAPLTGKTTLDRQLTSQGPVRPLSEEKDRTKHMKKPLSNQYILPEATLKRVKSDGTKRMVRSRDIGGDEKYHNMWIRDMWQRKVATVVIVIDHRHLVESNNVDNQMAVEYIVECLRTMKKPKGLGLKRIFQRKYHPARVIILANKADLWLDTQEELELWQRGAIMKHEIFQPFHEALYQLQEMNIPTYVDAVSAQVGWNVDKALFRGIMDL